MATVPDRLPNRVTPMEWLQKTGLGYEDLAQVSGYSYDGVKQWFKRGTGKRNPPEIVYRFLAHDLELRQRNAS